jgi:hypothetical protein
LGTIVENFIRVYKNAYSAEYCNEVIQFFEFANAAGFGKTRTELEKIPRHVKDDTAVVLPSVPQLSINFSTTTNLLEKFLTPFLENFYTQYVSNFSVLNDIKQQSVHSVKIQKTCIGGGYHIWHAEDLNKKCSSRINVFTLYLNTVEEGAETEFLYYGIRVKPEQGTLIIWPAGFTHTHRGNPPLSGDKYIVTGWVEVD